MDSLIVKLYQSPKTILSIKDLALIWQENNEESLYAKTAYYVKQKALIRLTRGVFAKNKDYNPKELATSIYIPSYISFETVLREAGVIFQHYDTIFAASKWPKTMTVDKYSITFRKLKDAVLYNSTGIVIKDNYSAATAERAFLDMIYLFPNYYFDNLTSIDWEKCDAIVKIYDNKQLIKRLDRYKKIMLNREKHQLIIGQILKDIYTDVTISPLLGFKGGTCAYLFYNLPRFSVDLDFDLFKVNEENQKIVFEKIAAILSKYGVVKGQYIKRFTVFALLSYGDNDHNIKVEINVRKLVENIQDHYEMKEYLGISMFVAKKDYLFASKLSALTSRNETATRDIFDVHFFAKSNWDINSEVIKERTGKTTKEYLADCAAFIEKVKDNQMLRGLGELVNGEKEKAWIKTRLKTDSIFMLKNYISVMK